MGSNSVNFDVSIPEVRPLEKTKSQVATEQSVNQAVETEKVKITESNPRADDVQPVNKDSVQLVRDEESGRSFVQVMDRKGEVLYQIPPEELRKLQHLLKHLNGNVVNKVV